VEKSETRGDELIFLPIIYTPLKCSEIFCDLSVSFDISLQALKNQELDKPFLAFEGCKPPT
jgi:hypothetical protein